MSTLAAALPAGNAANRCICSGLHGSAEAVNLHLYLLDSEASRESSVCNRRSACQLRSNITVALEDQMAAVQVWITCAEHRCRAKARLHTYLTMMVLTAML